MTEPTANPFASPSAKSGETASVPLPTRPVSFSGKLSAEEAVLLAGRRTIRWTDLIFLAPAVCVIAAIVLHISTYGFSKLPDAITVGMFCYLLVNSFFCWTIVRSFNRPSFWESEPASGTIGDGWIHVILNETEICLSLAEHQSKLTDQGIKIAIGKATFQRPILISRHWFLPGEFEIACEAVRHAESIESEDLPLHSDLIELPATAIPIYCLDEERKTARICRQLFASRSMLISGLGVFAASLFMLWSVKDSLNFAELWVAPISLCAIGIFLMLGYAFAKIKILSLKSKHPLQSSRELQGWIDHDQVLVKSKYGITKINWNENVYYMPYDDSTTLSCLIMNPAALHLFPEAFATRDDWLKANAIIKAECMTTSQYLKRNRKWGLLPSTSNRVR